MEALVRLTFEVIDVITSASLARNSPLKIDSVSDSVSGRKLGAGRLGASEVRA
jgi:hypothetical protein